MAQEIPFETFRQLKDVLDSIPEHLLDQAIVLNDYKGNLINGGFLVVGDKSVYIWEGDL